MSEVSASDRESSPVWAGFGGSGQGSLGSTAPGKGGSGQRSLGSTGPGKGGSGQCCLGMAASRFGTAGQGSKLSALGLEGAGRTLS